MAYGVWSGLGVTAITIIGAVVWGELLNAVVAVGIALIIAGVVLLESPSGKRAEKEARG